MTTQMQFRERIVNAVQENFAKLKPIIAQVQKPARMTVESVKQLKEQGTNPTTIARIFGFRNPRTDELVGPFYVADGGIDLNAIDREAAEPGSVIPDDWMHPQTKFQNTEYAETIREIKALFAKQVAELEAMLPPVTAPETEQQPYVPPVRSEPRAMPMFQS